MVRISNSSSNLQHQLDKYLSMSCCEQPMMNVALGHNGILKTEINQMHDSTDQLETCEHKCPIIKHNKATEQCFKYAPSVLCTTAKLS